MQRATKLRHTPSASLRPGRTIAVRIGESETALLGCPGGVVSVADVLAILACCVSGSLFIRTVTWLLIRGGKHLLLAVALLAIKQSHESSLSGRSRHFTIKEHSTRAPSSAFCS